MKARNRVVAMLLAGGQGSRLKALTKKLQNQQCHLVGNIE